MQPIYIYKFNTQPMATHINMQSYIWLMVKWTNACVVKCYLIWELLLPSVCSQANKLYRISQLALTARYVSQQQPGMDRGEENNSSHWQTPRQPTRVEDQWGIDWAQQRREALNLPERHSDGESHWMLKGHHHWTYTLALSAQWPCKHHSLPLVLAGSLNLWPS